MHGVLRCPAELWDRCREWLLGSHHERMAYLLARCSRLDGPRGPVADWLVRRALPVPEAALVRQSTVRVEVDPVFCRAVLRACFEGGCGLVDVHTHPFAHQTIAFSGHDHENMRSTHAEFAASMPQEPPALAASLVVGQDAVAGAWWEPGRRVLRPLERFELTGDRYQEVPLCR